MGFIGTIQEGRTAEATGKYNQKVLEAQAEEIERKTAFDQTRQAEEGSRIMSTMQVAKQRSELELSNLMIGREGTIGAAQARAEGAMARWQGKQAKKQSYMKAAGEAGTMLAGFA
jgi:hypothetical protein